MKRIINQYKEPIVLHLNAGLYRGVMQKTNANLLLDSHVDVEDEAISPEVKALERKGYVRVEDVATPPKQKVAIIPDPPKPSPIPEPKETPPSIESKSMSKGKKDRKKRRRGSSEITGDESPEELEQKLLDE